MGFADAPVLLKVGFIISILGFLFHLIGLATPYWTSGEVVAQIFGFKTTVKSNNGLWLLCAENEKSKSCSDIEDAPAWMEACQAFAVIGFLASLAVLFFLILYMCVEKTKMNIVYIIAMLGSCVAAACIFLAVVVYGAKNSKNLSWSFALSIIGMLLEGVTFLLLLVNRIRGGSVVVN